MSFSAGVYLLIPVLILGFWRLSRIGRRPEGYPPGPPTLPIIGNLHQIPNRKRHIQFQKWAEQYGPIYSLILGTKVMIVLNTDQTVKDLVDKRGGIYSSRPESYVGQDVLSGGLRILFMPDNEVWKMARKLVHRILGVTAARSYIPYQDLESKAMLFDVLKSPDDFVDHLRRYTASLTTQITFGSRTTSIKDERFKEAFEIFDRSSEMIGSRTAALLDLIPALRHIPDFLMPIKKEGRKIHERELSLFRGFYLAAKKGLNDGSAKPCVCVDLVKLQKEEGFSDTFASYLSGSLLQAGSETTASILIGFVQAMVIFPAVAKTAQAEIDRVCGDHLPSLDDMSDLPYIHACMKESLRWMPGFMLGIPHATAQQDSYLGYHIPRGATVIVNVWAIHNDPERHPSPRQFNPMRYINDQQTSIEAANNPDPTKRDHFVFGAGRRRCQGMHIADRSLFLAISRLLWAFDFDRVVSPETGKAIILDAADITEALETSTHSALVPYGLYQPLTMMTLRFIFSFTLLTTLAVSSPLYVPSYFQPDHLTRREVPVFQIQQELGALLSENSLILLPSNPLWIETTKRWNTMAPPDIKVVVQPAKEVDIPKIVSPYFMAINFLVVNRGHGLTKSLGAFKGMQIDMKQLRSMDIARDGKSAWFQGGAYAYEVIPLLWDRGYVTSTGSNQCVGLTGPALGGGHGRYEGLYGLAGDNIVEMKVVLADGSTITVSDKSNKDLFWAMRGAGHNFGIVTNLKLKIYPAKIKTWHYHNYYWRQDKLERVFRELNKLQDDGKTPPLLGVVFGQIYIDPSIRRDEAILWFTFAYAGPASEAERILRPFSAIDAIKDEMGDVPYPEIPVRQNTDISNCVSARFSLASVMLQTWNITTERALYNHFMRNVALYPDLAVTARLYYEGYGHRGVQAVDSASTAYPHRDEYHIAFFATVVPEGSNLLGPAEKWAREARVMWYAGAPTRKPATYINYASGNDYESLKSIYGYESWRLARLRKLKAKYDPNNRFRF
ncbi:cytochrome p450 [Fusarium mexicanum]|uniref:Cytochrome p450 n=1 Tax=Fusarium mexicanum TaxID=751941 RepID=A0A8H5JP13_9HYPO|nr:cytochrome p450 [Fusarium mexicanum]